MRAARRRHARHRPLLREDEIPTHRRRVVVKGGPGVAEVVRGGKDNRVINLSSAFDGDLYIAIDNIEKMIFLNIV